MLILDLSTYTIGILSRKFSPVPICSKLFPTSSSIRFSVSGFMLRSLIYLALSYVQGDKNESICILVCVDCQLKQNNLLKMLSFFFHWMVLTPL